MGRRRQYRAFAPRLPPCPGVGRTSALTIPAIGSKAASELAVRISIVRLSDHDHRAHAVESPRGTAVRACPFRRSAHQGRTIGKRTAYLLVQHVIYTSRNRIVAAIEQSQSLLTGRVRRSNCLRSSIQAAISEIPSPVRAEETKMLRLGFRTRAASISFPISKSSLSGR